jgi:2-C-methyl-D-erythritol 2,4-cyclodiphosphate synthase
MGYDIHRLAPNRKLIVGGVEVPFFRGLWGHSDADVLVHAVIDAILGAFSMGDIGSHFPDSDVQYKDASSTDLLARIREKSADLGTIHNVDSVIIAERPKMAPYIGEMRERIAGILGIPVERVSVKAKTAEGTGAVGDGQAIEAYAVALVDARG